jgi:glycerol-3-phosphate cytidylyltransferase
MVTNDDKNFIVGFTCSAFDLFHAGHLLMLKEAKAQCDYLIVGLHVDPSLDRPEKNSPVQSVLERWIQLQGCSYVDEIVPYETESDLLIILQNWDVDLRILGKEYMNIPYTGDNLSVPVYFNSRNHGYSSSSLRTRVLLAERENLHLK